MLTHAHEEDEEIIKSTRNDTMKYQQLLECPNVAILVHDFPNQKKDLDAQGGRTYSITLNGVARYVGYVLLVLGLSPK